MGAAVDLYTLEAAEEEIRKAEERAEFLRRGHRAREANKRHWARSVGRRNVRGGRRADGISPYDPVNAPGGEQLIWLREDATNDGAGNVNPWIDKWVGLDMAQTTQANRPNIVASDANFNNQPVKEFNGTSDVLLAPTSTEASFKPLSDGTGFLAWCVFRSTSTNNAQYLFGTCSSSVQTGFRLFYNGTTQGFDFQISNGTTDIVNIRTADGIAAPNTLIRLVLMLKDGLAPADESVMLVNGVKRMAATVTGTFPSGNPTSRLCIGRLPSSATSFFVGRMAELGIITRVDVAANVDLLHAKEVRSMTRLRYKLEETTGRRLETWFEVTGAEAALATQIVAGRGAVNITLQRGRQGLLYWPKAAGGSISVGKLGWNSVLDNARPVGTGLPRRLVPFLAQSDGAGRGILGDAPADLSSAARAYLFDHSFDYAVSVEPASSTSGQINATLSDSAPTYSPMTRMLQRMALNDPTHEYVGIPCCVGATSSVDWGVKTGAVNELYGATIFRIRMAQLILGGTIPFIVVGQCTTNGSSSALAASWDNDWDAILTQAQTDLAGLYEGASLRAIFTKVQAVKPAGLAYNPVDWTTLQGSADALVSASRKLVQLPGTIGADLIHETTAGLVTWADDIGNVANSNGWLSAA